MAQVESVPADIAIAVLPEPRLVKTGVLLFCPVQPLDAITELQVPSPH